MARAGIEAWLADQMRIGASATEDPLDTKSASTDESSSRLLTGTLIDGIGLDVWYIEIPVARAGIEAWLADQMRIEASATEDPLGT